MPRPLLLKVAQFIWLVGCFFSALLAVRAQEAPSTVQLSSLYLPLVLRPVIPGATWSADEIRVVELVNQERAKQGCSALRMDDTLHRAAYGHSADMLARDFVAHTNPDGKTPGQRLTDLGYAWWSYGENIAAGQPSPEAVMNSWMSSSGHRHNILNCALEEIGVGYVYAADDPGVYRYGHYWTQVFAIPQP